MKDDFLQALIEQATVRNQGPYEVARMILLLNFAAVHTSSHVSNCKRPLKDLVVMELRALHTPCSTSPLRPSTLAY